MNTPLSTDLVLKGQLHVGVSTYIDGEWVRANDYRTLEARSMAQAAEIQRLRTQLQVVVPYARRGLNHVATFYGNEMAANIVCLEWEKSQ